MSTHGIRCTITNNTNTLCCIDRKHNYSDAVNQCLFTITIKSVCTVFKPKAYKLYLPTVFIGSDAL